MMNFKRLILSALAAVLLISCHNPVMDYEGDCEVKYWIEFVYDMNLKWADAFPSEVNSVNLYVFDSDGLFVKEFDVEGEPLSRPGYRMLLDLKPGEYQLVAWCGLENGSETETNFKIPDPVAGETHIDDLTCSLITQSDSHYPVYSDKRLYFLYHGNMTVYLPDSQDGRDYYYTMYLTKDTNHIRAMVQQISSNLYADMIDFEMTAANGEMAYNNDLIGHTPVAYFPWNVENDIIGISNIDGNRLDFTGVIADLSTCRLMASQQDDVFLTLTDTGSGRILFNVPVIQYALTAKSYYEMAYGHNMSDQEFLDRQDEYLLTFFIDERMNLLYTVINILEWRVVITNYDVGN